MRGSQNVVARQAGFGRCQWAASDGEGAGHEAREQGIAGLFQNLDLPLEYLLLRKPRQNDTIKLGKNDG